MAIPVLPAYTSINFWRFHQAAASASASASAWASACRRHLWHNGNSLGSLFWRELGPHVLIIVCHLRMQTEAARDGGGRCRRAGRLAGWDTRLGARSKFKLSAGSKRFALISTKMHRSTSLSFSLSVYLCPQSAFLFFVLFFRLFRWHLFVKVKSFILPHQNA